MGKPLAFIGGLIAIIGIVLSLFLEVMSWYTIELAAGNIISGGSWTNAFGANNFLNQDVQNYFSEDFVDLIPAIIAALGALMCLSQKKGLCFIGGIAIILGVVLFLYLGVIGPAMDPILEGGWGLEFGDAIKLLWSSETTLGITTTMRTGYGAIVSAVGGLLGIIGAFGGDK